MEEVGRGVGFGTGRDLLMVSRWYLFFKMVYEIKFDQNRLIKNTEEMVTDN